LKILVTGTAGFIGYALAKKLLERGDEVIGIDNINNYYDVTLKYGRLKDLGIDQDLIADHKATSSTKYKKHKFLKMDLADRFEMEHLFDEEKFDAVCHLAAQAGVRYSLENPYAYVHSNLLGFTNVIEGCRHNNVKNLVYASSSSVYGLNKSQPFKTTDKTEHPVSFYAATKKANEMIAHSYSHLYNIPTTGVRFFTVYGPWGRPDMAPMLFANAISKDKAIKVFNNGNMSRDFTYIDDIVNGLIKIIDNPAKPNENWDPNDPLIDSSSAPYRILNIGNNQPVSLMEFIETLENALGKKAQKNFLPMQDGDVVSTYADVSALVKQFHYKPTTTLKEGIGKFIQWYREFYKV